MIAGSSVRAIKMSIEEKKNIFVTVAIPVYNGARFLESAVHSIVNQYYPVCEIIIVDDHSTDNTYEIVEKLKNKLNNQIINYYKNIENIGYPKNWNRCFEICKTRYLVILHQDDELKKYCISKQLNFLEKYDTIALVGGLENFIDSEGRLIKKQERRETKIFEKGKIFEFVTQTGSYIPCSSVMFDMEKIRKVGYFDEDVIATDELYWPKVLAKYPIAILGESLINRRAHPDQTEYGDFIRYEKDAFNIYKKFQRIIDYEEREEYKKKIEEFLAFKFARSWIGHIAPNVAKRGYRWLAIKYICKAIKVKPTIVFHFPKLWKSFAKMGLYFIGIKKIG